MSIQEPGPYETATDLSRELLRQAYPDQPETWINEKADDAARSIKAAVSDQFQTSRYAVSYRRPLDIRRRIVLWGVAVAAVLVVGVVVFAGREWVTAALAQKSGVYAMAVITVLTLGTTIWLRIRERFEKVLSCRIRIDTRFGRFAGEALELTGPGATAVQDPGMVVVRVKNLSGAVIEPEDYIEPLRLRFPDRVVRTVEVTESEPPELQNIVADHSGFRTEPHSIALPAVPLAPDDSYYVVAILSGTEAGKQYSVTVLGRLRRGRITTESTIPWIRRRTIAVGAVATLAVSVLAVSLLLYNVRPFTPLPESTVCVDGSLAVEGSSAFGPATIAAANQYGTYCPGSHIDVRTPGSIEGLKRLHDAPVGERSNRLAVSDGMESLRFTELKGHPVAVIPFTLVANNNVPVAGLSLDQARDIFTGKVGTWGEITGDPALTADVRVVVRADNSGTRRTLQQYVLGTSIDPLTQAAPTSDDCEKRRQGAERASAVVCERGTTADVLNRIAAVNDAIGYADMGEVTRTTGVKPINLNGLKADLDSIQKGYPFWTVEYVYSYGEVADGSLAKAFIDYLSHYLLRVQTEAMKGPAQPDYFACGADPVRQLCARNDR